MQLIHLLSVLGPALILVGIAGPCVLLVLFIKKVERFNKAWLSLLPLALYIPLLFLTFIRASNGLYGVYIIYPWEPIYEWNLPIAKDFEVLIEALDMSLFFGSSFAALGSLGCYAYKKIMSVDIKKMV